MKKNVLIIILLIIILGLGGYLVYDKVLLNDNENNVEEKEEQKIDENIPTEEDFDLTEAKKLIDKYYFYNFTVPGSFDLGFTDVVKFWIAYNNVAQSKIQNMSCNSLYAGRSDVSFDGTGYVIGTGKLLKACDVSANVISYNDVLEQYKALFGNSSELKKEAISLFDYDYNQNAFIELNCRCGGVDSQVRIYGIKDAKIRENKLIINVGYTRFNPQNYNSTTYIANFDNTVIYSYDELISEGFGQKLIGQYSNKIPTYKFTFFKEDGVYKLESMVKE